MTDTKFTPLPGYEVSSNGAVLSISTNWRGWGAREMKWSSDGSGYPVVRLTTPEGVRKKFKVHQLVCRAFHGEKPAPNYEVCHIDGDPMNNKAENIRWGTRSDNAKDRVRHGRQYYLPWSDPKFKAFMSGRMRGAVRGKSQKKGGEL